VTTFPKAQAARPAAAIAKSAREVTRAHARLDSAESVQSLQATQISTANTNITTANSNISMNATAIAAINTRLGMANMAFLATLGQMSHYNETAMGGWTSGGSILGSSQIDAAVLVAWMNQVAADIGVILTRLQSEGFMA
jgi:hypothetical protein